MSRSYDKYRNAFNLLVRYARRNGIRVRLVKDRTTRDYVGMNTEAGRAMGFGIPEDTIYIDANMDWETRYRTLKHELNEVYFMRGGDKYWMAHQKSLDRERRIVYPEDASGKLHVLA